ncbi:MAG: hypothetical protein GWN08_20740, partial [Gemmatimonadetes bacterium]|nr:hypothetical protein [Gemmatimonadota bacterium]NIW77641.1 hypothetical protein [Gemmatimonadota bacterium]
MTATVPKFIGSRIRRKEDPRLITGRATYADDRTPPRTAHLKLVRSTEAHAKITKIDTAGARKAPGVVAVLTTADLGDA